jgi:uncharacterized protein (TIGR03067 family)
MKHALSLGFLVFVVLSLSARAAESKGDAKALEGTWLPTMAELAGEKFPDEGLKSITLTLSGSSYTVMVGKATDKGTVKLDPGKKPKTLDITGTEGPNKGKTFLAIYELKGDTLRVCYDLSGKARPEEFKTKADTQLFLVTYKRKKPNGAAEK